MYTYRASFQLTLTEGLLYAQHVRHFCPLHLSSTHKPEVRSCTSSIPNTPGREVTAGNEHIPLGHILSQLVDRSQALEVQDPPPWPTSLRPRVSGSSLCLLPSLISDAFFDLWGLAGSGEAVPPRVANS